MRPVREQLLVSGRDRTSLATAMEWQADAARTALATSEEWRDVSVTAALCFVDAEFPLFGTLKVDGVHVRGLDGIAKLVSGNGPLDAAARDRLAGHLAERLPAKAGT